jgi:aldehyde:ferredoxin oxidoreductase
MGTAEDWGLMLGMIGKMLRINLSTLKTSIFSIDSYIEKYLGGRGIASRLYWEEVAPEVKAFDPANKLIFINGSLVGTGVQAATVMAVAGKSPGTYPEGYCYGFLAGYVGTELKKAGFDGIIIEGSASEPVYVWIEDQQVKILTAGSLWGKSAYQTSEALLKEHGRDARFITIGVSGERKVRTAIALASFDSTLSCGFGAVMGSKNLKAIVVKGSGKISVADPEKLSALNRYTFNIGKRLHAPVPFQITSTGHGHLLEVVGKASCYKCGSFCHRSTLRYGKRTDLTAGRRCQAVEYYLPWLYGHEEEPIETLFLAPVLANDYSIDTFELESIIRWLYACYKEKCLSENETGLPLSKIGTREFLEKLLHSIAFREGFGDVLAEGQLRAGEKVSGAARALYSHQVAAIGQYETTPTRKFIVQSLLIPMEPRPDQPLLHAQTNLWMAWEANLRDPSLSPVDTKVVHAVAKAFWGSQEAGDMASYAGKPLAAVLIQDRVYLHDSLGLCNFTWPITYSFNTQDCVGDPNLEGRIFNAVTGRPEETLKECAGRIVDLQRSILMREGRRFTGADYPREYLFTEPLTPGIPQLVPGPDGPVDASGNRLDKVKHQAMLQDYYTLRKWNRQTGWPETPV